MLGHLAELSSQELRADILFMGIGAISLEHLECNAACDYAPVVMVNWEFHDDQTPATARDLVDRLRAGEPVAPTRGPDRQCTFKEMSRVLAGFPDGLATQGVQAGPATLAGFEMAQERGESVSEYSRPAHTQKQKES